MSKPVILAVDDEPEVLELIGRDLRQHYSETYRVMKASSGREALSTVQALKQRGADVRSGSGKRVAAAVGEGSATIAMVHNYLETV